MVSATDVGCWHFDICMLYWWCICSFSFWNCFDCGTDLVYIDYVRCIVMSNSTVIKIYLSRVWLVCFIQIGSPTALAQASLEQKLKLSAKNHGLYVPSGAFWGSEDIRKMADRGNLQVQYAATSSHSLSEPKTQMKFGYQYLKSKTRSSWLILG